MAPAVTLLVPTTSISADDPVLGLFSQRDVPQSAPYAITLSITRATTTYTTTLLLGGSETTIPAGNTDPPNPQNTQAPATTAVAPIENASPSNQSTIIGATVGSICGVILLVGLVYVCYILNGRQSGGYGKASRSSSGSGSSGSGSASVGRTRRVRVEQTERIRVVPPPPPPMAQRGGFFGGGRGRGRGRGRILDDD